mgnify:CR=1 FL=1
MKYEGQITTIANQAEFRKYEGQITTLINQIEFRDIRDR